MAGQGKKTFVAGEVLLAQDVNDYLMDQSVMNFATTAARSSAIPTPTTGMVSYVGDTGTDTATNATIANVPQIQAYTGATWQNVDGLTLVAKATMGTSVSTVTMTNVFSAAHQSYKIIVTGGSASTAVGNLTFTLGGITTGYYATLIYQSWTSGALTAIRSGLDVGLQYAGGWTSTGLAMNFDLHNPFANDRKWGQSMYAQVNATYNAGPASHFIDSTASATSFTLAGGTFTGATIYVYGYRSS
jgi:hypothetical protein